ncbi:hypothetical protein GCM10028821_47040 [Hymenobacter jeollabukensis]
MATARRVGEWGRAGAAPQCAQLSVGRFAGRLRAACFRAPGATRLFGGVPGCGSAERRSWRPSALRKARLRVALPAGTVPKSNFTTASVGAPDSILFFFLSYL